MADINEERPPVYPFDLNRPLKQGAAKVQLSENIYAVLINEDGTKEVYEADNIVTDDGDTYYAQRGAGEVPTNAFGIIELGTAGNVPAKTSNRSDLTTPVATSQKAHDAGYPQTNDPDTDNPGSSGPDIITYRTTYTTVEANAVNIDRIIITNVTPGAAEPVLAYAVFAGPFTKVGTQTLKVFTNHNLNGV